MDKYLGGDFMNKNIVDYAHKGTDWVKGYISSDAKPVYEASGVRDFTAIKLYNEAGELVEPVDAPQNDTEIRQHEIERALIEIAQMTADAQLAIMEIVGGVK